MTYGKSACFRIEANFEPLYHPLQAIFRFLPSPLPPVDVVPLAEFLPHLRTTNGLPSSISWIIVGHLGGSYRPEAHVSIRCDKASIVITGLRCHFGLCVSQPAFACYKSRPLQNFTFRFSMCPFPWRLGVVRFILAPRCPLSFVQSVARDVHQSRDILNGWNGGFNRNPRYNFSSTLCRPVAYLFELGIAGSFQCIPLLEIP